MLMKIELEEVLDITMGEFPLLLYSLDEVREETFTRRLFADLPRVSALRVVCTELDLLRDSEQMIQTCRKQRASSFFRSYLIEEVDSQAARCTRLLGTR